MPSHTTLTVVVAVVALAAGCLDAEHGRTGALADLPVADVGPDTTPDVPAPWEPDTSDEPDVPPPIWTWRALAPMATGRSGHTATLLPDGRVLVTGGNTQVQSGDPLTSTELYDPSTDTWNPGPDMSVARWEHAAALLDDGRVLIAGGERICAASDAGCLPPIGEVFDPASDAWAEPVTLQESRSYFTATLLDDSRVLLTAGHGTDKVHETSECLDLITGETVVAETGNRRYGHGAVRLHDGRVLVAGGVASGGWHASAIVYDPDVDGWSDVESLQHSRTAFGLTLLDDRRVLAVGGYSGDDVLSAELFDPATESWSDVSEALTSHHSGGTAVWSPPLGLAIMIGGSGERYVMANNEAFDAQAGRWMPMPPLLAARVNHTATVLADGRVLVIGGHDGSNNGQTTAEVYAP